MLYRLLKILVRPAMFIFCRRVFISHPQLLKEPGPLLLACNHPNSFLDAIIIDMVFKQPVWSLARGDVFKNKFIGRLLNGLKILPVYRSTEGVENLSVNYKTFDACLKIFRNKGTVSIFSEGKCVNEWHLRNLKKGTARLAIKCWEENIPLKVLPVGINYSSFGRFGKNIYINFGNIITPDGIDLSTPDGAKYQLFTNKLSLALQELVFEIPRDNKKMQKEKLSIQLPVSSKILLSLPAIPGYLAHVPLYWAIQLFTRRKAGGTGHYDSVLVSLLFIIYPFYLSALVAAAWYITKSWYIFLLLLLPFCAWAYVQLKPQLDR